MHAMASHAGQRGPTHHSINSALAAMVALAIHLLRRCTTPPACQSRIKWPKRGCCSNHVDKRGELRAAAHAATSKKGTVGSTGKNTPKAANARLNHASTSKPSRVTAESGARAGAGCEEPAGGDREGGGSDEGMAGLSGLRLCLVHDHP